MEERRGERSPVYGVSAGGDAPVSLCSVSGNAACDVRTSDLALRFAQVEGLNFRVHRHSDHLQRGQKPGSRAFHLGFLANS